MILPACAACSTEFDPRIPPGPYGRTLPPLDQIPFCWTCSPPEPGPDLSTFPGAWPGFASCPHCGVEIDPPPGKMRACKACGETFWVRRIPTVHDDAIDRRILTRAGVDEAEDRWAEELLEYTGTTIVLRFLPDDHVEPSDAELRAAVAYRGRQFSQARRRAREWHAAGGCPPPHPFNN